MLYKNKQVNRKKELKARKGAQECWGCYFKEVWSGDGFLGTFEQIAEGMVKTTWISAEPGQGRRDAEDGVSCSCSFSPKVQLTFIVDSDL